MAGRKKGTGKASSKVKKSSTAVEVVAPKDDDPFSQQTALYGELFWEYRAKTAEYEKALVEVGMSSKDLKMELSDPKYKRIVELLAQDEKLRNLLKEQANLLRGVQLKVAAKLGVPIETFLKDCMIDYETGVVRFSD